MSPIPPTTPHEKDFSPPDRTATAPDAVAAGQPAVTAGFRFDNSYARELAGLFVAWPPARVSAPQTAVLNATLAQELRLDLAALQGPAGAALLAGNAMPAGATPIAQAYAGHQFGGYSPLLGDGRALLLGEVLDRHGRRRDIAFKGSGRTPFSRGGDGKAALGPMLREYLIGEAMHALGIPTTRALAVVATGEPVLRESGPLPGAVLTRVAASHLRVGTFQYAAAQDDQPLLLRLVAYALARHDPELANARNPALALLQSVAERQARLVAQWMGVGFVHGVMNTDNMTISGETIDYGPCAFMDRYDPTTVFSSIDHHGRYAYGNQPAIARWNLARLAEALLPLLDDEPQAAVELATAVIEEFPGRYQAHWQRMLLTKLGLLEADPEEASGRTGGDTAAEDEALAQDFLALLHQEQADFTLAFWHLADQADNGNGNRMEGTGWHGLLANPHAGGPWLQRWHQRLAAGPGPQRAAQRMRQVNPWVIPRNQRVQEALDAASEHGNMELFNRLLALLQQPFVPPANAFADRAVLASYTQPAPSTQSRCFQTFCGT
jgi:serine/tyrosine/threonine adenylyltransferase